MFDIVASFDFDEGSVGRCVAFTTGIGDMFASHVEPVINNNH